MTLARADSFRALYGLAQRLRTDFRGWIAREGERAPSAAKALARLAIGIAEKLASDVDLHNQELLAGRDVDSKVAVGLAERARFVEQLHEILDHSTYESLHPVLSPTVRHELDQLRITGSVLATGTRDASYEILTLTRDPFVSLAEPGYLDQVAWPIRIFRVPHPPLDWPLHHVLLYHELGHAAFHKMPPPFPPELDPTQATDLLERMMLAKKLAHYHQCMSAWMEEIYADTVGVLLAGPAYALAFARFLCSFFPLDTGSSSHPPIALRIELITKLVADEGYLAKLSPTGRALLEDWEREANEVSNYRVSRQETADILDLLVRDIRTQHSTLLVAARGAVSGRVYDAGDVEDDIERGRWMFELGLPAIDVDTSGASESVEPLNPARIFSAAWMAYVQALDAASDLTSVVKQTQRLAEVLLGSLDGADAARAWNEK